MIQVLRVEQHGVGKYEFLNKDGEVLDPAVESTILSAEDADVLMERICQGYQYVPGGHYILRLELTGSTYDESYFEFTELVTFASDDDGYPVPQHTRLIPQIEYDAPSTHHHVILSKVAFIDYEAQTVEWLFNPLAEQSTCINPEDVPVSCEANEDTSAILSASIRSHMRGQPTHVSPIIVRFYKG